MVVLLRAAAERGTAMVAGLALLGSSAWLDFATSGLENALSYLLVVAFVFSGAPDRRDRDTATRIWWLGALLMLNRIDFVALVAPVMLVYRRGGWRAYVALALPLGWLAFATIYYGHPLPNSVLAKINLGHSRMELASVGLEYLGESLVRDPLTLILLGLGAMASVRMQALQWSRPYFLGALAYVTSIVVAGGDFMSGRFFSVPFVVAIAVFSQTAVSVGRHRLLFAVALTVVSLVSVSRPLLAYVAMDDGSRGYWILDERAFYAGKTGMSSGIDALFSGNRIPPAGASEFPGVRPEGGHFEWSSHLGRAVAIENQIGYLGVAGGPQTYVLDTMALADPVLSRLPPKCRPCRPGHYERRVPPEYLDYLHGRLRAAVAPAMADLIRDVHLIAFGDVFASGRAEAILRRLH